MKRLIFARRLSQVFFLILFIYILWSTTYPLKGILPPATFFKLNPLIIVFTSISARVILPGIYVSLGMLFLTAILGRFFCGWVCPLGATVDLTTFLRKGKRVESDSTNKRARKPKFFILLAIIVASLAGAQFAWILDPLVIMARFVSLNLIPSATLILDKLFITLIKNFNLYGPFQDFYRGLKASILGIRIHYFSHSLIIFAFFLFVVSSALFISRFWCRALCPLGALYSVFARFSLLRRVVKECEKCGKCKSACRMGAIKDDSSYVKGECVLCMDCIYDCPFNATRFTI